MSTLECLSVILICILLCLCYSDSEKCPPGATGQFVYRPDCRRFLNCWKGRGLTQVCAPGTLFNPETLQCDFPSKVKCLPMTPEEERWNNVPVNNTGIVYMERKVPKYGKHKIRERKVKTLTKNRRNHRRTGTRKHTET